MECWLILSVKKITIVQSRLYGNRISPVLTIWVMLWWRGLTPRELVLNYCKVKLHEQVKQKLKGSGFEFMFEIGCKISHMKSLLLALVHAYETKIGFCFGQNELYFGLEDVLMITGLPIDAHVDNEDELYSPSSSPPWDSVYDLLGLGICSTLQNQSLKDVKVTNVQNEVCCLFAKNLGLLAGGTSRIVVFSSRVKNENAEEVRDGLFGKLSEDLLFTWCQDQCTKLDHTVCSGNTNPNFLKELEKVWTSSGNRIFWFGPSNTLLVDDDDSPSKAVNNPINNSIFHDPYHYTQTEDIGLRETIFYSCSSFLYPIRTTDMFLS
ncbi:hypothetical protein K1719_005009 [Acacia pycnantha]|nr:hypothetical protein K1719_005009 [Acacia pycnantha]